MPSASKCSLASKNCWQRRNPFLKLNVSQPFGSAGPCLLVLPGWDDDGKQQYDQLRDSLVRTGWHCGRASLPDASWSAEDRDSATRGQNLAQALHDYDLLVGNGPTDKKALLGFSYGGYIAAMLVPERPVDLLVLRSPALYPNEHWDVPKAELDKRELAAYRSDVHTPGENLALDGCYAFTGHALLIDSEDDKIIPREVIQSYRRALVNAASITCHTLTDADHQLSDEASRAEYHALVLEWLADMHIAAKK